MNANQNLQSKRQEIIQIAAQHGATNVRLFGSVRGGEAWPGSDVDFLVNLEANRSLLDLRRLLRELQSLLNCPVDVVTEAGLRPRLRPQVLKEARPL
jgi:uncharacterized protein